MQRKDVSMSIKIDFVNKLLERWRDAGRLLKHLLMFVSLNMQALRKIVKKQNKLVGALDPGAGQGLNTTLLIAHPHEDVVHKQGSHLSRAQMKELEEFQKHEDLEGMQTFIKERIMQLVQVRAPCSAAVRSVVQGCCGHSSRRGHAPGRRRHQAYRAIHVVRCFQQSSLSAAPSGALLLHPAATAMIVSVSLYSSHATVCAFQVGSRLRARRGTQPSGQGDTPQTPGQRGSGDSFGPRTSMAGAVTRT